MGYTEIGGLYKRLYAVLLKPSENLWANFDRRFEVKFQIKMTLNKYFSFTKKIAITDLNEH